MSISEKIDQFCEEKRQLDLNYNSNKREMLSAFHKEIEDLFLKEGCQIPKTLFRAEGIFGGNGRFVLITYTLVGIVSHTSVPVCINIKYESSGWVKSRETICVREVSQNGIVHAMEYSKLFFTAEEAINDVISQLRIELNE